MSNTEAIITLIIFFAFVGSAYYLIKAGLRKLSKATKNAIQQKQRVSIPDIINKVMSHIPSFPDCDITSSDEFRIAGITFGRYAYSSAGILVGYATPEPTNKHNTHAIVLKSYSNHELGYIANDQLDDYYNFAQDTTTLPFCCELSYFTDENNKQKIMGRIILFCGTASSIEGTLHRFFDERPGTTILQ